MSVGTDEAVDLKFRLFDGSDIGPEKFGPATTVVALKETILRLWPTGMTRTPAHPCKRDLRYNVNVCTVGTRGNTLETRVIDEEHADLFGAFQTRALCQNPSTM